MNEFIDKGVVVCRPALQKDTDGVMELCSHIWEGGDYIPLVWDEWLADPDGLLGVAEMMGRVVGVFKLTKFQDDEWYMEGLRVHPDFRERGIASHIHHYVVDTWRRMGKGVIRLATHSENFKVQRMCDETGFKRVAEVIPYRADALADARGDFTSLTVEEAEKAMEFIMNSPAYRLSGGLINLGWVFGNPQLKHIEKAINEGHAWWWRNGQGFLSIWEDEEGEEREPGIQAIGCQANDLAELLLDYRRRASELGYKSAGWVTPNMPEAINALEKAGYQRTWDKSLFIYELSSQENSE